MKKILGFKVVMNITLWVLIVGTVVFSVGFGTCLYIARQEVATEVSNKIDSDMAYIQNFVDGQLQRIEDSGYTLLSINFGNSYRKKDGSSQVSIDPTNFQLPDEESVFEMLEHFLNNNPHICGAAIGFEKGVYPESKAQHGFAAYVTNVSGENKRLYLGNIHDFHIKEWYHEAFATNKPYWSCPFRETSMDKVVACFSIPLHGYNNRKIGVLALDIDTEAFRSLCSQVAPFPGAEVTIVDRDFRFICHSNSNFLLKKVNEVGDYKFYKANDSMKIKMLNHENGKFSIKNKTNEEALFFFKSIKRTGWTISVECPYKAIYHGVERMKSTTTWIAIISILFMIISFIWMFRKLQSVTTAKIGIERDLHIASAIQMGMIPKLYPAFPERNDLDICGLIKPAKTVGGDLYDYFIHDEKFYFCIGDVSGKGVPASLFMAVVVALFRNVANREESPAGIAETLNRSLAEGNEMNMFCTMFIGILDLRNGHLSYCNAGHNAPIIRRLVDQKVEVNFMQPLTNIVLGIFKDYNFKDESTDLAPGEAIFLYTDGVTEAESHEKVLFGDEAVLKALASARTNNARTTQEFVTAVYQIIAQHTENAEQSDDITMLVVEYKGSLNKPTKNKESSQQT